jgi:hypothetical protein
MGVLKWFGGKAKRQAAIDSVQLFFEISKRLGAFPAHVDPCIAAGDAIDLALARVPELIERSWSKHVLAAVCLSVILLEEDESLYARDLHAMALYGMLEAAKLQQHRLSYEEMSALDTARRTYLLFRSQMPSPPARPLDPGPMTTAHPPGEPRMLDTPRSREASRAELVRRMREADGKA